MSNIFISCAIAEGCDDKEAFRIIIWSIICFLFISTAGNLNLSSRRQPCCHQCHPCVVNCGYRRSQKTRTGHVQVAKERYWKLDREEPVHIASLFSTGDRLVETVINCFVTFKSLTDFFWILIDVLLKHMKLLTFNFTEETFATFAAVKDDAIKLAQNALLDPASLAMDPSGMHSLEKQKVLLEITAEDMKTFAEQLLNNQFYVWVLIQGNVSAEQAYLVTQNIMRHLDRQPSPICVNSMNKNDSNSIVSNFYPGDESNPKNSIILEIIVLLIEGPLFDTLRTKEQLGYTVHCYASGSGISVDVYSQADKYSTRYVDERIDLFMKQTLNTLKDIPESMFEEIKRRLIKKKSCANNSLVEDVCSNWDQIIANGYPFDWVKSEAELIKKLKQSDVLDWWKKCIYCDDKDEFTCRKISRQVRGYGSKETFTEETDDKAAFPQDKMKKMDKANVWRRATRIRSTVLHNLIVFFVNSKKIILSCVIPQEDAEC